MKLIKPLTVLSLSALLSVSAYAEPNKKPAPKGQKPQTAQPQKATAKPVAKPASKPTPAKNTAKPTAPVKQLNADKPATSSPKVAAPVSNNNAKLAEFSRSLGLTFNGVKVVQQNNQPYVTFSYVVKNKAKRSIKTVHWAANYVSGNQIILTQDVPITFEQPLKPNQSVPLNFSTAWENLPQLTQQALISNNGNISAYFQAKSITFSNNRKIVVE